MTYKEVFGLAAAILTFLAFWPYIRAVLAGQAKPHVFSWIIWGTTTFLVFLAQLADGGGIGAWPIGLSGVITIGVAVLAYMKRADDSITATDWAFLAAALGSLPLWYLTRDPTWAAVVLTAVDLAGFGPTFRKAYRRPFEEQLTFFVIMAARNVLSLVALEHYSLATTVFPAAIALACAIFIAMVLQRRAMTANLTDGRL